MTTGEAIREYCKKCVNSNQKKVIADCGGNYVIATKKPCALYKHRLKGKGNVKAIRRECMDCMRGSSWAVEDCQTTDCDLYTYRMGRDLSKTMGDGGRLFHQNQFKPQAKVVGGVKQP